MYLNDDFDKKKNINGKPRVSFGIPVFNGENHIREALDSILNQKYTNFEVIISDNASTDKTRQICLEYAAKDNRIKYYRNKKNFGASKNHNRVFQLSSGEYFKWAAHDDAITSDFLQKCVNVLDNDNSVVCCHSRTARIDENGKLVGNYDHKLLKEINSEKPYERFGDLISIRNLCWYIFGVIRTSSLRSISLLGNFIGADHALLAELGLKGRFYEIPEYLFYRRDHPNSYTRTYCEQKKFAISSKDYEQQAMWWGSGFSRFPWWTMCFDYFRSVREAHLKLSERLLCYSEIYNWILREGWIFMCGDIDRFLTQSSPYGEKFLSMIKHILHVSVIPILNKVGVLT